MGLNFTGDIGAEIDLIGATVSLVTKGTSTFSDYGDEIFGTTSSETFTAVVNDVNGDEEFNKEGIFSPGDKVFFAKNSIDLTEKNKDTYYIGYDSEDYKIVTVLQPISGSTIQVKEIRCKRN